jgi:hemerythrin superfamily protein
MILRNFRSVARRKFLTFLGGSVLFGVAVKNFVIPSASAQTPNGDAIDILIQDHRTIADLLLQIAQTPASNPTQRTQLLQQLANLLTVHNASEENFIYPAIRNIAGLPRDASLLFQQQDNSKIILFSLNQVPPDSPQWDRLLATLTNALVNHVSQEENVDFPRLRQTAGPLLPVLTAQVVQLRSRFNLT